MFKYMKNEFDNKHLSYNCDIFYKSCGLLYLTNSKYIQV